MSELDSVMNNVMRPVTRMLKIKQRAVKLGITLEDVKKMSEKEIQEKFGDL